MHTSAHTCCGKNLWHVCSLFSNACTCTCICGLFLRLQLPLHLRLHWVCKGLHVSAGFHCICTCVASVFTPALHLRLRWCCHAARFAVVLLLGCTCPCDFGFRLRLHHLELHRHELRCFERSAVALACTAVAEWVQMSGKVTIAESKLQPQCWRRTRYGDWPLRPVWFWCKTELVA